MGVDYLVCKHCGRTFPDCGDYVRCNDDCYAKWCCDECAEADGLEYDRCELGYDIDSDNGRCERQDCYEDGCEYYIPDRSCSYCREEDYSDGDLLEFALGLLGMSRQALIDKNNSRKEKV